MTFADEMQTAKKYLDKEDFDRALKGYAKAWLAAQDGDERSQVCHMRGITLRLAKRIDEAEQALIKAYELVTSHKEKARIQRDLGQVYLDKAIERGNDSSLLERARRLLYESFLALQQDRPEAALSYELHRKVLALQAQPAG